MSHIPSSYAGDQPPADSLMMPRQYELIYLASPCSFQPFSIPMDIFAMQKLEHILQILLRPSMLFLSLEQAYYWIINIMAGLELLFCSQ